MERNESAAAVTKWPVMTISVLLVPKADGVRLTQLKLDPDVIELLNCRARILQNAAVRDSHGWKESPYYRDIENMYLADVHMQLLNT